MKNLKHSKARIKGGGKVIILDTGAIINPEAEAMLQALHSRSTGGLESHLKILEKRGPENFMKNFYVGYGHKSIGDCGTISIFIEGVSILVAKAIQDWPLYSGQESSTRYIDFKTQPFKNPAQVKQGEKILENWRKFYSQSLKPIVEHLKKKHPLKENESEKIYNKAIDARSFDILRGFLPAGSTTNLAWHTNLRQAADKIMFLRHNPLEEVKNVADAIERALIKAYPNSFSHKRYEKTEKFNKYFMEKEYYYHNSKCPDFKLTKNNIDEKLISKTLLRKRPPKTELPRQLTEAGDIQFEFLLDFGSYRDLQRHRSLTQRMPLLTNEISFEKWYLDELPKEVREKAIKLLKKQKEITNKLKISKEEKQYYIPMGYNVSCRLTGGLPAWLYIIELRATCFVHPTLRKRAKQMAKALTKKFKYLKIHLDKEIDRFDIKRGEQDIVLK
ncbi:MAG: FAD-dependent thymidylate synthase [Patescibacteria group bacterium]|nr:FAD-dependent thymidylate synthase [Patescibacteria group bacterium]